MMCGGHQSSAIAAAWAVLASPVKTGWRHLRRPHPLRPEQTTRKAKSAFWSARIALQFGLLPVAIGAGQLSLPNPLGISLLYPPVPRQAATRARGGFVTQGWVNLAGPATRSRCTSCWLRTFQYRVTHGTWESRETSVVALSGASWTRYAVTRRPDASTTTSRDTGIREPPDAYYLTRIQALISDLLSEGCDIDLAARQGTLGLTLALRSARRSSSYLT